MEAYFYSFFFFKSALIIWIIVGTAKFNKGTKFYNVFKDNYR